MFDYDHEHIIIAENNETQDNKQFEDQKIPFYPTNSIISTISQNSEEENCTFDYFLNKIGFGWYHIRIFVILGIPFFAFLMLQACLLGMADGSEAMVLSFILPVFQNLYPSYSSDIEFGLGTAVYIGYLIGSLISGYFSDKYGRRRPVMYSELIMTIFGLLSAFPPNLLAFIIFRGLFGIVVGFFSPLSYTIMAEITPAKHRGKYMTLNGIFYTFGELISCGVAYLTVNNLQTGDWHALLVWSTAPAFTALCASLIFLDESPRHELILGNYNNAFKVMEKMYKYNNGKGSNTPLLTENDKAMLIKLQDQLKMDEELEGTSYNISALFQGENKFITPTVWYDWFCTTLTYYGVTYILPTTLVALYGKNSSDNESNDNIGDVALSCLVELPTVFIAAIFIDIKIFGRKNFLALNYLLGGIGCIFCSLQFWPNFITWIAVSKFCLNLSFLLIYQYTSELYPTKFRGSGIGLATAFGRIGSIIMPLICTWLSGIGTLLPFIAFGITSIIAGVSTALLKFDTAGKEVGEIEKYFQESKDKGEILQVQ